MNTSPENEPDGEMAEDQPCEDVRDIPLVASQRDYTKLGIAAFIGVGTLAIIAVAADGLNKPKAAPLTQSEAVEFNIPSATKPYIQTEEIEHSKEQKPDKAHDALAMQREMQMQQEALRMAKEQEQRYEERLRSKQLIYDQTPKSAQALSRLAPAAGTSIQGASGFNSMGNAMQVNTEATAAVQIKNLYSLIAQGTMIDGILETAIQSDLPGMVRAVVSEDVYSFDSAQLLIPKGARLIGQYKSGTVRGQSRVFIIWNRILRNDGVSVNISSYGTDDLGRSGLGGTVDTHFLERFSGSMMLSLLDAGLAAGVSSLDNTNTATVALKTGNDFSRAAEIALENSIDIPPTIHIDQGSRIKVFVGQDIDFSAIQDHQQAR
ncbi:MAG TPA: TrbI/VirB10 family protein [Micavibrio sp.]|nr:TrbI/VirB10 family protein [Micavibrio sp.]